ncbi:MAG: hypothetical protein AAF555_00315 [Verrucomicrobiota bacterium]
MASFPEIPTPPQLFRQFDEGRIAHEELLAKLREHALLLIEEMEENHAHPLRAFFDAQLARHAAAVLRRKHGEPAVREILAALAQLEGFPPAHLLWNAEDRSVPLPTLLRQRQEPVFRILHLEAKAQLASIEVEWGRSSRKHSTRERFELRRDWEGRLRVVRRNPA